MPSKLEALFASKLLFWIYIAIILIAVILPLNTSGGLNTIVILQLRADYLIHILLFLPWAFFRTGFRVSHWLWFPLGILFACGTEGLQYFLPYRTFNINDLLANGVGVTVSYAMYAVIGRKLLLY